MKTEIDRELVQQISNCRNRARNFAFVPGNEHSVLLIDSSLIGSSAIKAAQKKADAERVFKGICHAEVDPGGQRTLVFTVKTVPAELDRKLRKAIKENAGLSLNVEVRAPSRPLAEGEELVAEGDDTPDEVRVPRQATQEQKDVANKALYKKMLALIGLKLTDLEAVDAQAGAQLRAKVLPLLEKAEALVGTGVPEEQRDYKAALQVLIKVKDTVLTRTKKTPSLRGDKPEDRKPDKLFADHFKDVKEVVKKLQDQVPDTRAARDGAQRLEEAAGLGRLMNFAEGIKKLEVLEPQVRLVLGRLGSWTTAMDKALALTEPPLPRDILEAFERARGAALNLALEQTGNMLGGIEDRLRDKMVERDRVVEANKAVLWLLPQARKTLPPETTDGWEDTRSQALGKALDKAYAELTDLEAKIRKDLRLSEPMPRSEVLHGETPEARKLKFQLNVDNLRRALAIITKSDPENAKKHDQSLRKILAVAGANLEEAETMLQTLSGQVRESLKKIRDQHDPQKHGPWTVELPEQQPGPNVWRFGSTREFTGYVQQHNVLGRVRPGKEIGKGGYGTVNILESNNPNEEGIPPLVMKVFTDPEMAREEAEMEVELYKKVGDHPNIPKCLGIQQVGGQTGLVLERVQGRDMGDYSKELRRRYAKGEITFEEFQSTIQYTLAKTLETLTFLHSKGLVHNDVKGPNVMVDEVTGEVKVIDLGNVGDMHTRSTAGNPLFKAPEGVTGERLGTGQTDAFSAGGIAYETMEGSGFHFGDPKGMLNSFMSKVEKVMQTYGESEDDEGVYRKSGKNNPSVRRVNERGEETPKGKQLKKDPKLTSARTQLTEFMNALMHPDPKKRLTPKEALEHPFLRDRLLGEDEIKKFIRRPGTVPPGKDKDAKKKRNFLLRPDNMKSEQLPGLVERLGQLGEKVRQVNVGGLDVKELAQVRAGLARDLEEITAILNRCGTGELFFGDLVAQSEDRNSETFFNDNRMLELARKGHEDAAALQMDLEAMLDDLDVRLDRSLAERVEAVKAGTLYGEDEVKARQAQIVQQGETVKFATADLLNVWISEIPGVYDRAELLHKQLTEVERASAGLHGERDQVAALVRALEEAPEGQEAAQRLRPLLEAFETAGEKVEEASRSVTRRLEVAYNTLGEKKQEVDALVQQANGTGAEIDQLVTAIKESEKFLGGVGNLTGGMSRQSGQEQAKFEETQGKLKETLEKQRAEQRPRARELTEQGQGILLRLAALQLDLGVAPAPQGQPNLSGALHTAREGLAAKVKAIPQL
jgi:serine/threonine protein kinase